MRKISDDRGVVTIELALVLTLFVVPIAIAVAKFKDPIINWVVTTSAELKRNSDLQEENNALLRQLLQQQQGNEESPAPSDPGNTSN